MVLVFHDVTDKRRSQIALTTAHAAAVNEKNRLSALFDALPVGVALIDAEGGTMASNRHFDDVGRAPAHHPVGCRLCALQSVVAGHRPGGAAARVGVRARDSDRRDPFSNQEMWIERFDGSRIFVLNSAAPIRDAAGQIAGSAVAIGILPS